MTTVVKVNGRDRDKFLSDETFTYVGRRFAGFEASPFANPYRVAVDGSLALSRFEEDLMAAVAGRPRGPYARHFREMVGRIPELRGRRLGCWCGDWSPGESEIPCHAVVLAKLADGKYGDPF